MKKLLALVLALVMSMSLVTISNAAFKDADSIDYKEAVDVMNAVGVFVGDEKGNFNAKENLTREQAAKIIAYLELGEKAADALVGGATGMIGDPSMKSQERKLLDEETLRHNQEAIKKQLAKFLDFESDAPNAAEMVNNYDWLSKISLLDFLRDYGKLFNIKPAVFKRLF